MKGYEVKFNIFAESKEEAEAVSRILGDFVNECARSGVAVSANKIQEAFQRWGKNPLLVNRIKHYFNNGR